MFAYARAGGTRAHPELKIEHRRIAEKLYYQNPICQIACDGDIDGDHKSELTVYRPSTGVWYHLLSTSDFTQGTGVLWGLQGDIPVDGDFDGDGRMDHALYRPSEGNWYIHPSSGTQDQVVQWGLNGDVPIAADFDGDGKVDPTVYRPSSGVWYVSYSSGFTPVPNGPPLANSPDRLNSSNNQWGLPGDLPIAADFDGDGRSDIAVYRPSTGEWFIRYSTLAYIPYSGNWYYQWGRASQNDQPVTGDFDGDGKGDIAVFRQATGEWFIRYSTLGYAVNQGDYYFQWGLPGDVPIAANFNADEKSEFAVYRPSEGKWYIRGGLVIQWGLPGDIPLPVANR